MRKDTDSWPETMLYVTTNGAYFNGEEIIRRTQVITVPSYPRLSERDNQVEGPYLNEEHMEQCSPAYNLLILKDSERAAIVLNNKIKKYKPEYFKKYLTKEFREILPDILEHTFVGNFQGNIVTGGHYPTDHVRPLKGSVSFSMDKITYGIIEIKNPKTGMWICKKSSSSLWPIKWSIENLVLSLAFAWENKVKQGNYNFKGKTSDGLYVLFCFSKHEFKTVFPLPI